MMPSSAVQALLGKRDQIRIYGVAVGVVTNNQDPDKLGRVKVKFPWLTEDDESFWARIATPMAGKGRGFYVLPEVDDEVLVVFEHGMVEFPYIVGGLWNGKDNPPEENEGQNNKRAYHSRSGHIIRFDDTSGGEKIEIIDKNKNQVVIDSSANTVTVEDKNKNQMVIDGNANTISISAKSDIKITSSTGKLQMSAVGVEITSQAGVKIQAMANMDLQASAITTIKGATVNIN